MTSTIATDGLKASLYGLNMPFYFENFNGSYGGWASSGSLALGGQTHTADGSSCIDIYGTGGNTYGYRTFTGLVPGELYVVTAWVRAYGATAFTARLEAWEVGGSSWTDTSPTVNALVSTGNWTLATMSFSATTTSKVVRLQGYNNGATTSDINWDDITIVQSTTMLKVKSGTITLDEAHSPYADASITIAYPATGAIGYIDPTANQRVTIICSKTGVSPALAPSTRTFDLRLRSATNNAEGAEITLGLSSDEVSLLISGKVATAVDQTYAAYTDLRTLVNDFLVARGLALSTGTVTADVTRTVNSTNLQTAPTTNSGVTGNWSPQNCTRDTADTTWSFTGDGNSWNLYSATSTDSYMYDGVGGTGFKYGMTPGKTYTFSATGRVKVAFTGSDWDSSNPGDLRTRRIVIIGYDSTGAGGVLTRSSAQVPNTVGAPTRLSVTFTIPVGYKGIDLRLYLGGANGGPGQIQWDGFMLVESTGYMNGTDALDSHYFDGNGAIPADTHYAYAWTGTAYNSTSTRTRLDSRSPDNLLRKPGTTAWQWINTIVQAAGLRLFCDELRVWRLVDNSYAVDGSVSMALATTLIKGDDTIDIGAAYSGDNGYVEAVVVHFSWIDSTGIAQERYDAAGTDGGITLVVERDNTPFPGAGAAAAILARAQGRKRTLDLVGLTNLATTPGMDCAATLPTSNQVGKVSSVTFDLGQDEMQVGTRGLVSTPSNAWIFAAGAWSAATGTWAGATGTN